MSLQYSIPTRVMQKGMPFGVILFFNGVDSCSTGLSRTGIFASRMEILAKAAGTLSHPEGTGAAGLR